MNRTERLIRLSKGNEHMCANCNHFHEHYIKIRDFRTSLRGVMGTRYEGLLEGHCVGGSRSKMVRAWKTCEHWEAKKEEEGN